MSERATLLAALEPIIKTLSALDPNDPGSAAALNDALPLSHPDVRQVDALLRAAVEDGWVCPKGEPPLRFGRVTRPDPASGGFSVDAVVMSAPGPGHVHPNGEFDLCFALSGEPTFDGNPPGWTVYPAGSWHVPTVTGGEMAILYFLPDGAIRFQGAPSL